MSHLCPGTPINASVVALAGSGVQLTCNLTGTVVWTKDGNPVMTSLRVVLLTGPPQKLYILSVQSSDEGGYQCAGGGRFMSIFLQVTGGWSLFVNYYIACMGVDNFEGGVL